MEIELPHGKNKPFIARATSGIEPPTGHHSTRGVSQRVYKSQRTLFCTCKMWFPAF